MTPISLHRESSRPEYKDHRLACVNRLYLYLGGRAGRPGIRVTNELNVESGSFGGQDDGER